MAAMPLEKRRRPAPSRDGELPLRHALGGVPVAAVLVALDAALEVVRDLRAVPEGVGRRLDDRRRQRAREVQARLAAVHRTGC